MEESSCLPFDLFDYDISLVTDGFQGNLGSSEVYPNRQVQVTDPGQGPMVIKIEKPWESKDTKEGKIQLQMGYGFQNNQQSRELTLQDAVENPEILQLLPNQQTMAVVDSESFIPNIEEINSYDLQQELYCLTNENFVEIQALPSNKKKNPPYMVKGKDITTLNMTPVTFVMSGAKPEHSVHISLRYMDEIFKKKAVNPCKNHQDCEERPENLPADFNFYLTGDCNYEIRDGHPTAIVSIQEDADEVVKFSIVFLCLSSCHKVNGKKIEVVVTVLDSDGNLVPREGHFTVRICKNVKRDHKERKELYCKRSFPWGEVKESGKVQKIENESPEDLSTLEAICEDNIGTPKCYAFQMKSKDKEDLVMKLIEALGGKCFPIKASSEDTT